MLPSDTATNLKHLEAQLASLETLPKREAAFKLESEVFVLRKRRGNLFRANQTKNSLSGPHGSQASTGSSTYLSEVTPLSQRLVGRHSGSERQQWNGTSLPAKCNQRLKKCLLSLAGCFEQSDEAQDGLRASNSKWPNSKTALISFLAHRHSIQLEPQVGYGLSPPNSGYVTFCSICRGIHPQNEKDFRRIHKYRPIPQKSPPLSTVSAILDFDMKPTDQQSTNQTATAPSEAASQVSYDDFVTLQNYVLPQQPLEKVFSEVKNDIFKEARQLSRVRAEKLTNARQMAYLCVRQVDRRYLKCQRNQLDHVNRAKKLHRECLLYWRKRERELQQIKKRKDRVEAELKKREEEEQEAKMQAKRLEYIMYQSSLYSHFMATKLGVEGQDGKKDTTDQDNAVKTDAVIKPDFSGEKSPPIHKPLVQIDQQAAKLNLDQILSSTKQNLNKFDAGRLDLSSVDQAALEIVGTPPSFNGCLKQYQIKGLRWLNNLFEQGINGILADEMGLGKTIQAIALLSHISSRKNIWGPFLIVAPNSTLYNWQQQFKKFSPSLKVLPYWGNIKQRKTIRKFFSSKKFSQRQDSPFHVVITSYQLTVTDEKAFKRLKWQFMILDEAQAIKNIQSQRWNILKQFHARNRLLLTGTPIQNSMAELWALLNFVMPDLFDSHELFNEWFSKDIEAHSQDQKELDQIKIQRLHAILKPFMLRRIKKDVQHEIGHKFEHQILCEMTKRQKILYDSIKEKLNVKQLFKMLDSKAKVDNLMNLVMQLRKVCNHPELFERRPARSSFIFQEMYCFNTYIPTRLGQIKLLSTNCKNPIQLQYPRMLYDWARYEKRSSNQALHKFNLLPSIVSIMDLSLSQAETVRDSDPLFAAVFMSFRRPRHQKDQQNRNSSEKTWNMFNCGDVSYWDRTIRSSSQICPLTYRLSRQVSCRSLSTGMFLNSIISHIRAISIIMTPLSKSVFNAYISTACAPPIEFQINSIIHCEEQNELKLNALQMYMLEGKYSRRIQQKYKLTCPERDANFGKHSNRMEEESTNVFKSGKQKGYVGLLANCESMSHIEVVDFGNLVADSSKLRHLDAILKEKHRKGDKVLIFCQMTKMIDILEDFMNIRKYSFFRLDGGSTIADRRDMVNEFQKPTSKIFVFLLSTRAGGLGVTLTAANTVVFYDNDWNPTMDAQATDRAHRIGQSQDVNVYQLVTKNTIEERIVKRAQQKKTVQTTVYEGASFNFFKRDMIMDLMADELGQNLEEFAKEFEGINDTILGQQQQQQANGVIPEAINGQPSTGGRKTKHKGNKAGKEEPMMDME